MTEYARNAEYNVVLFDPTWGTNASGLKLCCFTTVGASGKSMVLAKALIAHEDHDTFEWCFRCFAKAFKVAPIAFFSDSDAQIESAFDECSTLEGDVWAGCLHFLCLYHLSQNMHTHLHHLFVSKPESWRKVHSLFWRIAKNTDSRSRGAFHAEWQLLIEMVRSEGVGHDLEHQLDWLEHFGSRHRKWAARFTWATLTWGIHSTQRAEAIHSALKRFLFHSMLVSQLVMKVDEYNMKARAMDVVSDVRKAAKAKDSDVPHLIAECKSYLRPYAYDMLLAQFRQATVYSATADGDPEEIAGDIADNSMDWEDFYLVTRTGVVNPRAPVLSDTGLPVDYDCGVDDGVDEGFEWETQPNRRASLRRCSCQYLDCTGVLCRHMLNLYLARSMGGQPVSIDRSLFGCKWMKVTESDELHATAALRCRLPSQGCIVELPADSSEAALPALAKGQRYPWIMSKCRGIADLGGRSSTDLDLVTQALDELHMKLVARTRPPQPEIAADETVRVPVRARPNDVRSLHDILGVTLMAVEDKPLFSNLELGAANAAMYVGRCFAVKYKRKRQGGWRTGTIRSVLSGTEGHAKVKNTYTNKLDIPNYDCEIDALGDEPLTTAYLSLAVSNYVTEPEASAGAWMLLEDKPLSINVEAHDIRLPQSGAKGRPPSKRKGDHRESKKSKK